VDSRHTLLLVLLAGAPCPPRSTPAVPGPNAQVTRIEVAPGSSLRSVLNRLQGQGIVQDARAVTWYLRLKNRQVRVEAGVYEIPAHASAQQILTLFAEGRVVLEQLTVVEGARVADFLAALDQHPAVAHTLAGKNAAGDGRHRSCGRAPRALLPRHLPLRRAHHRWPS
jgi:cell division protein YceG involved in septum cleavage